MRKVLHTLALPALILFLIVGCSDDDVVEPDELTPPSNLRVTDIPLSGDVVELQWDGAVGSEDVVYVGYRIYAHTQPLQSVDNADDLAPYEIREVGSSVQSTSVTLDNSYTYYYVHVRAVTDEEDLSRASNEIYIIARPVEEGAIIYEFESETGNASGFDLSEGAGVSLALTNPDRHDRTDFFLAYAEGTTGGGDLYLWSPKAASAQYQNTAGFATITGYTFDGLESVPEGTTFLDHVAVTEGGLIVIRITDENAITNYAKISLTSVEGTSPDRTLVFMWAYQPEPGRPELVPAP